MSEQIPLFRVLMSDEAAACVADVLTYAPDGSMYVGEGPVVRALERALDEAYGVPGGGWADGREGWLAVNSCTSAIYLAAQLCGARPGAEIVSTAVTCSLTNSPSELRFARTVWADVDPATGLVDPEDAAALVTEETCAVVVVDFTGRRADVRALRAAMRRRGRVVPIIQDAAHLGPERLDPETLGDYVCLSFQGIKFVTSADGGALLAPPWERERARKLRWAGLDRESNADFRSQQNITEVGGKWHMTDVLAAIGLSNLAPAAGALRKQRECAAFYEREMGPALAGHPLVRLPPPDPSSHWWLYVLEVSDRVGLQRHLAARQIASGPVHRRNDSHRGFPKSARVLPGVDHYDPRQLAIPVGWWLDHQDRRRVVDAVLEWAGA